MRADASGNGSYKISQQRRHLFLFFIFLLDTYPSNPPVFSPSRSAAYLACLFLPHQVLLIPPHVCSPLLQPEILHPLPGWWRDPYQRGKPCRHRLVQCDGQPPHPPVGYDWHSQHLLILTTSHILQASVFSRPHEQISTRARHPLARE